MIGLNVKSQKQADSDRLTSISFSKKQAVP